VQLADFLAQVGARLAHALGVFFQAFDVADIGPL
jgi:hypothetical protein